MRRKVSKTERSQTTSLEAKPQATGVQPTAQTTNVEAKPQATSVQPTAQTTSVEANHFSWALKGFLLGVVWTAVGCLLALIQGDSPRAFLKEWMSYQGPFLLSLEAWMLLMIRAKVFEARVSTLTGKTRMEVGVLCKRPVRILIVASITILGFASVSRMGFNGRGVVLLFMWFTNLCIDLAAGIITLHSLTIITAIYYLHREKIKLSHYAPARTLELRSVVKYFSTFTLLMTGCYIFALAGTLKGNWTGSKDYVQAIQWFWPIIYVPICCIVLIYPHLAVHKLIQSHKEITLRSYQDEIDKLLEQYPKLQPEDIGRTNELAQLFERITATPNYVIDFGIAVRTFLPLAFNLLTLFLKVSTTPR